MPLKSSKKRALEITFPSANSNLNQRPEIEPVNVLVEFGGTSSVHGFGLLGRSSKNSSELFFFLLLHTDIIYHQRNIPRATVSDYITDGPLIRCRVSCCHCWFNFSVLEGSSYVIRQCTVGVRPPDEVCKIDWKKRWLVPWVCLSSELWFAFYGHLCESGVGGEFTALALLLPHSLSCV